MGFSSQSVVFSIIAKQHWGLPRIAELYAKKCELARRALDINRTFLLDKSNRLAPQLRFGEYGKTIERYDDTDDGMSWRLKLLEAELQRLKNEESIIDIELESLKAVGTALASIKEEFTKYVAEGLKSTFKNNYAST